MEATTPIADFGGGAIFACAVVAHLARIAAPAVARNAARAIAARAVAGAGMFAAPVAAAFLVGHAAFGAAGRSLLALAAAGRTIERLPARAFRDAADAENWAKCCSEWRSATRAVVRIVIAAIRAFRDALAAATDLIRLAT